ncbi:MAG: hypothetical protein GEU99_26150 [Luteitalea sp.]|nr:hypothetical protein [Luteitalea sp.]
MNLAYPCHTSSATRRYPRGTGIAYCPEIPGANGQGRTKEEARQDLADAIALILEDRREEGLVGTPSLRCHS